MSRLEFERGNLHLEAEEGALELPALSGATCRQRPERRRATALPYAAIAAATTRAAPLLIAGLLALAPEACSSGLSRKEGTPQAPSWDEEWTPSIFERAQKENRLVLLDLGAVWCHWCHVMERTTYADPVVAALIKESFIAVRIDQDARPDLANRYEDYGWPATIIFNERGEELVKLRGYIQPELMASRLRAVAADRTPGPSVEPEAKVSYGSATSLPDALRQELLQRFRAGYDPEYGGWGRIHKYLDADSVELALRLALAGDAGAAGMARKTLAGQLNLIDPVWGGVYQYSHGGTWANPHFEKIMPMQAGNLRIDSLAYSLWGEEPHLKAARDIQRYLRDFLTSPEGALYTSQDADLVKGEHSGDYFRLDDAARRALGIPAIDKHVYSRENGLAVSALAALHAATGDAPALEQALKAARWILGNRSLPAGGFRHDAEDRAGPYLADTLAMGRAFLDLYAVTAEREWLERSALAAAFIGGNFIGSGEAEEAAGFVTFKPAGKPGEGPFAPEPQVDENVGMARWCNLLERYTGDPAHRRLAERAMRYLSSPEIAASFNVLTARILLADLEMTSEPIHITVCGRKDDPQARALFRAGLRYPVSYKRVEWYDAREAPLPNQDVTYPSMEEAAAFVCTSGVCSSPIQDAEALRAAVDRLAFKRRG